MLKASEPETDVRANVHRLRFEIPFHGVVSSFLLAGWACCPEAHRTPRAEKAAVYFGRKRGRSPQPKIPSPADSHKRDF